MVSGVAGGRGKAAVCVGVNIARPLSTASYGQSWNLGIQT
jgi:hypothetical protein